MSLKVFTSIRGKTILYFSVVLSLTTILIGAACYYFFSQSYRTSISQQNSIRLRALSNQLDTQVYQFTKQKFFELSTNPTLYQWFNSLLKDPERQRNIKIINTAAELRSLATFSNGIIGSIDIYYPAAKLSVSSQSGYSDFTEEPARKGRLLWETAMGSWENYNRWDIRQINSHRGMDVFYLGSIPNTATRENTQALAAFSLDPAVFSSYLGVMENSDTRLFIFTRDMIPLYGEMARLEEYLSPEKIQEIAESGSDGMVHETPSLSSEAAVSWVHSSQSPTILLSIVATENFRKVMNEVISFIMMISALTLLAGFIVSGFFSQKLYQPIKKLVNAVGGSDRVIKQENYPNEYSYINHAIDRLAAKASEYEATFNNNLKIMRYGFLQALFNNQFSGIDEILSKARFLNLPLENPNFRMMKVYLEGERTASPRYANYELLAYNVLAHMESLGGSAIRLYGIKNTGLSLSLLCNYRDSGPFLFRDAVDEALRYCMSFFSIPARVCVSEARGSLMDISKCCQELEMAEPYLFFCPERPCLFARGGGYSRP